MMLKTFLILCAVALCSSAAVADSALCADAPQTAKVQALYAKAPVPPTFMAAIKLQMPEAIVASVLDTELAIGTSGDGFGAVWASLEKWPDSTVVLLKGGSVFEVHGPLPTGAPSTKSQFFNLTPKSASPPASLVADVSREGAGDARRGLGGHLRPDLFGAIYAVNLRGALGPLRGISFVDKTGDSIFGVYLPEGATPAPDLLTAFEATRAVIASLPRVCGVGGST